MRKSASLSHVPGAAEQFDTVSMGKAMWQSRWAYVGEEGLTMLAPIKGAEELLQIQSNPARAA
jgi:hypothetical protein